MTMIYVARTYGREPLEVSGCMAWYDAADTSTLVDAGSGAVSTWYDKSGNGRDLTQGTGANRPTMGTRTLNGLNVVDFDGTNDRVASANITQALPVTVLAVVLSDVTTPGAGNRQILGNQSATTCPAVYGLAATPMRWAFFAGTQIDTGDALNTSAHTLSVNFINSASGEFFLDGASIGTGNPGASGWSAEPISLGGDTAPANFWDGIIAEVAIYDSTLSAGNRQRIEAYLKSKWGTP